MNACVSHEFGVKTTAVAASHSILDRLLERCQRKSNEMMVVWHFHWKTPEVSLHRSKIVEKKIDSVNFPRHITLDRWRWFCSKLWTMKSLQNILIVYHLLQKLKSDQNSIKEVDHTWNILKLLQNNIRRLCNDFLKTTICFGFRFMSC